jgi:putative ABC transport system permease protein
MLAIRRAKHCFDIAKNWISARESILRESRMSTPLLALIAFATGAILFVVALNILSLQVGSVGRRTHLIGLSSAVGASRRDLFLQYMIEFSLIGGCGGILGVLAAVGLTSVLQGLVNPSGIALPGLSLRALLATLASAMLAVFLVNLAFSIVPAVQAVRTRPSDAMRLE